MNKKLVKIPRLFILSLLVLSIISSVYADSNGLKLISKESINLTPTVSNFNNGSMFSLEDNLVGDSSKDLTLDIYDDNGVTIYAMDVDKEYQNSALAYINSRIGDKSFINNDWSRSEYSEMSVDDYLNKISSEEVEEGIGDEAIEQGPLAPGLSEYHNDVGTDGDAYSYAWKTNAPTFRDSNTFSGGQTTMWLGNEDCDYITLNQSITVGGLFLNITWPPGLYGNGSSASWQSNPIKSRMATASFSRFIVQGMAYSCTFVESGDVYVGSRIYRPHTYIKFSLVS